MLVRLRRLMKNYPERRFDREDDHLTGAVGDTKTVKGYLVLETIRGDSTMSP